jgi:8-oxo-dGTP pyrophosphatase MutT (NUDIX family)
MQALTDKTFGECDPSVEYYHRTGAYLVIVQDGMVAAIEHRLGYLLPGGGIEGEETHEETLLRECLEEIGYDVRVDEFITSADAWDTHPKVGPFHPIQYYYSGELLDQYAECGLDGTRLCWVRIEELGVPMQRYAVQTYLSRQTSAAALSFIDGRHHILDGPLSS